MKLRGYQEEDAQHIAKVYQNRNEHQLGWILALEQGLGKTIVTMRAAELARPKSILVLCPALARQEWRRQLDLHYPGAFNYEIVKASKEFAKFNKPVTLQYTPDRIESTLVGQISSILITGYNPKLLRALPEHWKFDWVVLDECQEVSNSESQTSTLVRDIIERCDAFVLPLSGTPALDKPEQLYHILSLCQPAEWGEHVVQFKYRWLERVFCEYSPSGKRFGGLNPKKRAELSAKVATTMTRRTQAECAHDLPPLITSMRYVSPKRGTMDWDDEASYKLFASNNYEQKTEVAVDLFKQAVAEGETKFVFFTALRKTAAVLGAQLAAAGARVQVVDGDTQADKRQAKIDLVVKDPGISALVCTIDSVGVALDFTWCQSAWFVETHWQPGMTSQAALRFRRLSSTHSVKLCFIVVEGTVEERKVAAFIRKQDELNVVVKNGEFESKAAEKLREAQQENLEDLSEFL